MSYFFAAFFVSLVVILIADHKGRSKFWWWLLSVFVGPLALVVGFFPNLKEKNEEDKNTRRCPRCDELIRKEAMVCKHCKSVL